MTEDATRPIIGVPRETYPGEHRVALVPATVATLKKQNFTVLVQNGAGTQAGFPDALYTKAGAELVDLREDLFNRSQAIFMVRALGANPEAGQSDIEALQPGQVLIANCDALSEPELVTQAAEKQAICFALELLPRITRAQSMDTLSSMATVAGYKAVLLAADHVPRMFPMMMTAAGTISPAKVFIMGAGVAGLQAIATAKRLGAIVYAYDLRPDVKEQVESLGGKFVELELDTDSSETKGGYAKEMDEEFYRKQRELMTEVVKDCHVVITTAAIPGKQAPILVTKAMVEQMQPGSVIVDLAAERGGNCEYTKPNETIVQNGVTILGACNLPATIPFHASEMYSKNITTFLLNMIKDGKLVFDPEDEIVTDTMLTKTGQVVNARIREVLGMQPLPKEEPAEEEPPDPYGKYENSDAETYQIQRGKESSANRESGSKEKSDDDT